MKNNKLIVILGPTATGKTKLAAKLAAKYNGEIVSADSRQIYRGMDIGTGKDLKDYLVKTPRRFVLKKIPYHLIDIVSPKSKFNVAKYQKLAYKAIDDILRRGKTPFLVGGTGLYIDAVIKGFVFNQVKGKRLKVKGIREKLNKLSLSQLLSQLKKIDLKTYKIIDKKNRRRVERALEIYYETGRPKSEQIGQIKPPYDILIMGIRMPLEKIYQKIDARLEKRVKEGMIGEVRKLRKSGVSWRRLDDFGLEYRYVSRYLRGLMKYGEMLEKLKQEIHHFAKRQMTWFKRDKGIIWLENKNKTEKIVGDFLKK